MSETNNATVGGPQPTPPNSGLQLPLLSFHLHPWELRMLRPFFIVYFVVAIIYCVAMVVPALGQWRLWPSVTFEASAKTVFYLMVGMVLLRVAVPFYWRACRDLPPAWWKRPFLVGALLILAGLAGCGIIALYHERLGDTLGVPLYEGGMALSGIGFVLYAVGHVGLMRAVLRAQRAARDAASGRATPPRSDQLASGRQAAKSSHERTRYRPSADKR